MAPHVGLCPGCGRGVCDRSALGQAVCLLPAVLSLGPAAARGSLWDLASTMLSTAVAFPLLLCFSCSHAVALAPAGLRQGSDSMRSMWSLTVGLVGGLSSSQTAKTKPQGKPVCE